MRRRKNAQMEILGLAIVMVIVVFGILLALRFFYMNPQTNPTQTASDVQLGANFLDTLLQTTTKCRNAPLSTLLEECAKGSGISCPDVYDTHDRLLIAHGTGCQHMAGTINYFLNQTLDSWGRKYELEIKLGSETLYRKKNPVLGCAEGAQLIQRPRPIGGGQVLDVRLKLCQ